MPRKQDALLRSALPQHDVAGALNGLLPTHPQYAALKAALAETPASDTAKRDRIRLNMDRWRWLPRDLGDKYIIVNVPELPCDPGRERRQPLEAAGDRRQALDADAAAHGDGDGRDPQSLVGSAQEHREGSRRQEGLRRRSRAPTARSSAGGSRRGRPTRSAR